MNAPIFHRDWAGHKPPLRLEMSEPELWVILAVIFAIGVLLGLIVP